MSSQEYDVVMNGPCSKTAIQLILKNIAFARGGAHLPIANALRLLFLDEIEIEKK